MGGFRAMSYILSILLFLSPVWDVELNPVKLGKRTQLKLKLKKSFDDKYTVLDFDQVKAVLKFRESCFSQGKVLEEKESLATVQALQLKLKGKLVAEKETESLLLNQKIQFLEEAIKAHPSSEPWKISTFVLGGALVGLSVYIILD